MFCVKFLLILSTIVVNGAPIRRVNYRKTCLELPEDELAKVLGSSYNSRYMSVDQPIDEQDKRNHGKRTPGSFHEDFYADHTLQNEISETPAWKVNNHVDLFLIQKDTNPGPNYATTHGITKKSVDYSEQWHCKSELVWKDLGKDYFPRYLRSVVCLSENCWFGMYTCKPRSFTVKILRRKRKCGAEEESYRVGLSGLPRELKELWVWEERAVDFCCDCVKKNNA